MTLGIPREFILGVHPPCHSGPDANFAFDGKIGSTNDGPVKIQGDCTLCGKPWVVELSTSFDSTGDGAIVDTSIWRPL